MCGHAGTCNERVLLVNGCLNVVLENLYLPSGIIEILHSFSSGLNHFGDRDFNHILCTINMCFVLIILI